MFARLDALEARFEELSRTLADPEVAADPARYRRHAQAYADLETVVAAYRDWRATGRQLVEARELALGAEPDMAAMAAAEARLLDGRLAELESRLKTLLLPRDPNDERSIILEVRAGTGGDEATLFAAEVFRMYTRYAESQGWRCDVTDLSESGARGIKEVVAVIEGRGAYSRLKYESGVHRVQRVPATEAAGRIHTSAVTVAVLPEAEEVEIDLPEKDLRIDRFCSSGPGGQSVNTTYSAVRITHLPTGLVVSCQDEKSQHKNREKALRVLRARLLEARRREQQEATARQRRAQVGSGDRSEKIRTYNFPQNRVTDHRIGLTLHRLQETLDGALQPLVDALVAHHEEERLREEGLA